MANELSDKPIVVIGGGPAGYNFALEMRKKAPKQRIILIEKNKLGGTCLHLGCIPSKLLHSVESLEEFPKALKKHKMILEKGIAAELKAANIEFMNTEADFHSKDGYEALINNQVIVNKDERIDFSYIIIACGSRPRSLEDFPNAKTSDDFFSESSIDSGFKDKYCFIGGGYIGVEIASILAKHGKKVRIIETENEILNFLDPFIREKLLLELKQLKIEIKTGVKNFKASDVSSDEEVFLSIGRVNNLPKKIIDASVSNTSICIVGDASEKVALAHYAYAQSRKLAYRLSGSKFPSIDNEKVPMVVFSHPELASIGYTQKQAEEKFGKANIEEKIIPWAANAKARISGAERGFTKWLYLNKAVKLENNGNSESLKEGTLIGCHIIGKHATDLISIAVPIINMALSIEDTKSWIYPHPTMGEIFAF